MSAGVTSNAFYLYYDHPGAFNPPDDHAQVFDLWDDFSGASLDAAKWEVVNSGSGVTVEQTGSELTVSGTTDAVNATNSIGIRTAGTYTGGFLIESKFVIASQSAAAHQHWKGDFGLGGSRMSVKNYNSDKQVGYFSGGWQLFADSRLDGATIPSSRVAQALSASGTGMHWEDRLFKASRTGLSTSAAKLRLAYSPDTTAGQTFDVRYDDVLVRKWVPDEPTAHIDTLAMTSVAVTVEPTMTFSIDGLPSGCNGVMPSSGASASADTVDLGRISPMANATAAQQLTLTTNAGGGFAVYLRSPNPLTSSSGATIASWTGTNASPTDFPALGSAAFAYSTSDETLRTGSADRFTEPTIKWAGFSTSDALLMDGAGVGTEQECLAFQVGIGTATSSGTYRATVIYTAVPSY